MATQSALWYLAPACLLVPVHEHCNENAPMSPAQCVVIVCCNKVQATGKRDLNAFVLLVDCGTAPVT